MAALLRIMLVATLAASVGWVLLEPAQKRWLAEQLPGGEQPPPSVVREPAQAPQQPAPAEPVPSGAPAQARPGDASRTHRYATPEDIDCRPATRAPTRREGSRIYHWSDEKGTAHFGDKRHSTDRAQDLSDEYATGTLEYFDFDLSADSGSLPPFFRDRLRADIQAIFRFLAGELGPERLRRIPLHMKVFEDPDAFTQLRQQYAPGMEQATGFYAPADHLAAVLEQPEPADTLRLARHEATHVINAGLFGISPLWFEEGMAEYFSDYSSEALHREFRPAPWRLQYLEHLLHSGSLPDVATFMNLSRQQWQSLDPAPAYSLSWSLVAWLLDHEQGRQWLRGYMHRLAAEPCNPESGSEQVATDYPGGMAAFERSWRDWLAQNIAQR